MFNSLLENINRRNRSYDLIGQQPVRPQIQRISPVNITPEVQNVPMPISPGLSAVTAQSLAPPTAQVPDPVAQELPLPQSQGLTPPVAQELPLPQSQGLTPPVAQEMGPPQPMELDLPKEITSTDLAQGAVAAIKQGGIQGGDEGAAQGFGQWMQKVASDDEAMGSIILALNSLRTKPDANLATAMREQISASRKQRKETATKNRTLEVLKGLPGVTDEIMKIAEVDPLAAIKMATEKGKREAPATEASRTRLDELVAAHGQVKGSAAFEQEQQESAIERARATVPMPPAAGTLGIKDLQNARTQVRAEFKPYDQPLEMIDQAVEIAGVAENNSQAEAQLDKMLAQVSGDRQTSMIEVNRLANTGPVWYRVGNVFSKWLTGTQTEFSLNEKKEFLNDLREFHRARREDHETFLKDLYTQSNWPDEMVGKLFNQPEEITTGWSSTPGGVRYEIVGD